MTVVAVGRGKVRNALVVDWVKGALQPDGKHLFDHQRIDKTLQLGGTVLTVVGDDQVLQAAYNLGLWCKGTPDFLASASFDALVRLTDRLWIIHGRKAPHARRPGFTLVCCEADRVFHRKVDVAHGKVTQVHEPEVVAVGALDIIYGGKVFWGASFDESEEGLVDRCVATIRGVDEKVRHDPAAAGCHPLPYPFPERWSVAIMPTDGSPATRHRPFGSVVEELALENEFPDLLDDKAYMDFPNAETLPRKE